MKRLLLIDAYAMIYRAYYAFIRAPRMTSRGENTSAIFGFLLTLEDLLKRVKPTHLGVAFDPAGPTFRHEAFEQYKAQREATPEDIRSAVPVIKEILAAMNIPALEMAGYEADDLIGTLAKQAEQQGFEVFMATPDKDYGQLVSEHIFMYRPRHSGGFEQMGIAEVCEKYDLKHQSQVIDLLGLMGDSSDNIPGCVGVGEKTAVKLLQEFGDIDTLLANTDKLKGALKQKVETQVDQIRFSRFLATIKTDVPITLNEDLLIKKEPNQSELTRLYTHWEFRTLLRKSQEARAKSQDAAKAVTPSAQLDLFGSPVETPYIASPKSDDAQLDLFATPVETLSQSVSNATELHIPEIPTGLHITYDWKAELKAHPQGSFPPVGGTALSDRRSEAEKEGGLGCFDTSIAHYLIQPESAHDIDYLSEIYLHYNTHGEEAKRQQAACALYPILKTELEKNGAWDLFTHLEMPLVPVLVDMEEAGVRFDVAVLRQESIALTAEMQTLETEIQALAGEPFNINSPKQVGDILFGKLALDPKAKKTKGGQYVTSEEVLLSIADRHPIVHKILEYRGVKKLLGTYIDALPALINPQTGKIHTTYNQTVTATGRLSSSNPNLQNLPIRTERGQVIRKAVIPDNGCIFLSADYSQIELRLMAHFSQDEHLLAAFREGQDIHAATAAKIFGIPIEAVTKEQRRKAKTANFGIIYGISAFGLSQQLGSSRREAQELIDSYFAAFPGVINFIEQAKENARAQGFVETLFHRKRYLPDINSRNATVRSFAERNAVNAPIQGTAADIIKRAMIRIHSRLLAEGLQAQMIMQVHDELNFNVPTAEVEQVRKIVVEEMQQAVSLTVPLIAECGVGENWLAAH